MQRPLKLKLIFYAILLSFSALFILSAAEIGLRYVFSKHVEHDYDQWRGAPYQNHYGFQLNSGGFLDIEYPLKRKVGKKRIVALGDSYAFGALPYKYNFLTLLDSKLPDTEIINLGIPGTSVNHYRNILINEALKYKPDKVLLFFFIGNDFTIHLNKRLWNNRGLYLSQFSNYYKLINTSIDNKSWNYDNYNDTAASFNEQTFLNINRDKLEYFNPENKKLYKEKLKRLSPYFQDIWNICRDKNMKFQVVIIPDQLQADTILRQKVLSVYPQEFEVELPNRHIARLLDKLNIDYFDMYGPFIGASRGQTLYIPRDTHWNIAGNHLAADVLTKFFDKGQGQ